MSDVQSTVINICGWAIPLGSGVVALGQWVAGGLAPVFADAQVVAYPAWTLIAIAAIGAAPKVLAELNRYHQSRHASAIVEASKQRRRAELAESRSAVLESQVLLLGGQQRERHPGSDSAD